jgi:hypothetical protein
MQHEMARARPRPRADESQRIGHEHAPSAIQVELQHDVAFQAGGEDPAVGDVGNDGMGFGRGGKDLAGRRFDLPVARNGIDAQFGGQIGGGEETASCPVGCDIGHGLGEGYRREERELAVVRIDAEGGERIGGAPHRDMEPATVRAEGQGHAGGRGPLGARNRRRGESFDPTRPKVYIKDDDFLGAGAGDISDRPRLGCLTAGGHRSTSRACPPSRPHAEARCARRSRPPFPRRRWP